MLASCVYDFYLQVFLKHPSSFVGKVSIVSPTFDLIMIAQLILQLGFIRQSKEWHFSKIFFIRTFSVVRAHEYYFELLLVFVDRLVRLAKDGCECLTRWTLKHSLDINIFTILSSEMTQPSLQWFRKITIELVISYITMKNSTSKVFKHIQCCIQKYPTTINPYSQDIN